MFYKIITNGYITVIGTGNGGTEITEEEYNSLLDHIRNCPEAPSGYGYRLKEDLTWELYELPVVPDEEISSDELLTMIEGVL